MKGKYVSLLLIMSATMMLATNVAPMTTVHAYSSDVNLLQSSNPTQIVDPHAVLTAHQVEVFNQHNQALQQRGIDPINVIVLNPSDLGNQNFNDYANQVIDNGQSLNAIMQDGSHNRLPQYQNFDVQYPTIWILNNPTGWVSYFAQVPVTSQQFKKLAILQLMHGKTLASRQQALTKVFMHTSQYVVKHYQAAMAAQASQDSQNQTDDNQGTAEGPTLFQQSSEDSEINAQEANHSTSFLSPVMKVIYNLMKWGLGIIFFIFMALGATKRKRPTFDGESRPNDSSINPNEPHGTSKPHQGNDDQLLQPSDTYTMQTYDKDTDNQIDDDDYTSGDSSSVLGNHKYDKP